MTYILGSEAVADDVELDWQEGKDDAKGHVAGAANIPTCELFIAASLAKLPTGRQIAVCY